VRGKEHRAQGTGHRLTNIVRKSRTAGAHSTPVYRFYHGIRYKTNQTLLILNVKYIYTDVMGV